MELTKNLKLKVQLFYYHSKLIFYLTPSDINGYKY